MNSLKISIASSLPDAECFVGLKTEAPTRVLEPVLDRELGVPLETRTVHRLQEEAAEIQLLERARVDAVLRVDELQLVALAKRQLVAGLRAYADPIDAARWRERPVGLDGHLKAA